jgi:hypothetical protein
MIKAVVFLRFSIEILLEVPADYDLVTHFLVHPLLDHACLSKARHFFLLLLQAAALFLPHATFSVEHELLFSFLVVAFVDGFFFPFLFKQGVVGHPLWGGLATFFNFNFIFFKGGGSTPLGHGATPNGVVRPPLFFFFKKKKINF